MLSLVSQSNKPNPYADPALIDDLSVVTFFTTTRCNARCETCFYWQSLNNADEKALTLDELDKVTQSMPKFQHLLFSGGEPVMRKEIVEIAGLFAKNCGIMSLDMPTNGLLPKRVEEVVDQILENHPQILFTVGLSLDGLEETHNKIRGVPGNWKKSMDTMARLGALRQRRMEKWQRGEGPKPQLRLMTLTCINNQNIDEIEALSHHMKQNDDLDGMVFECLRGTPKDETMTPPTTEQFDRMIELSMRMNAELHERRFPEWKNLWLSYTRNLYRFQKEHLTTGKIPSHCKAGVKNAVIEPEGEVRMCELMDVVGDLRKEGYDWNKVWLGAKAVEYRRWIKEAHCSCTHCVNLGQSIDGSFKTRMRRKIDEVIFSNS